jgi:hypothetical protein
VSRWLGPILLVGVFLRHDTSQWLPGYSPQAWFYVLGGLWEIALCVVVLVALPGIPLLTAAMWIGVLEGSQISTCRLLTADITAVPKGSNLCDHLTGLPIGATMTALYLGIVCWAIGKAWRTR